MPDIDPRPAVIADRLSGVGRVIGVGGSKGGTGKTAVASLLALALADRGVRVGLFDLDFTSPSAHLVLGIEAGFPSEEFGIDPHVGEGIATMSVAFFAGEVPAPLRGAESSSALLELLAITRWGDLDILLLDMPPGLGDATLDVVALMPRLEFLLVGTASRVVLGSVRRAVRLLTEIGVPLLGVVENLRRRDGAAVADLAADHGAHFLGALPFDEDFETALGSAAALRRTVLYGAVGALADTILSPPGEPGAGAGTR
jgi:ATP-binding protein involved in chromosome partitioning